jgi:hypothetical protein
MSSNELTQWEKKKTIVNPVGNKETTGYGPTNGGTNSVGEQMNEIRQIQLSPNPMCSVMTRPFSPHDVDP